MGFIEQTLDVCGEGSFIMGVLLSFNGLILMLSFANS